MESFKPVKIGKTHDGEDVYLARDSLAIERGHYYLVNVSEDEIPGIVHGVLGEKELHGPTLDNLE